MPFTIIMMPEARRVMGELANSNAGKHKKVQKTLGLLQSNPRHPGLHTHEYTSLQGPNKEKVYEAYVENNTPAAYRVFWYYGPKKNEITIISITPHP